MSRVIESSTVNVARTHFFTNRKSDWWNLNSVFQKLHKLNALALTEIEEVLEKRGLVGRQLKVLDVGCGGGILAEPLARAGATVLGIDINKDAVEAAQAHASLDPCFAQRLSYKWESVEEHCLDNVEKYDVVLLAFVLHHAERHDLLLNSCVRTLKPGGVIFVGSFAKTYESWFRIIFLGEMLFGYNARGSFDWNHFINSSDVQMILERDNCVVENIRGMRYDMFSACWSWMKSVNSVYIMHAVKQ